jgi:predicted phage baseplate assembly protein
VSAPTPDGIESTLEVFVDGVRWKHVPDFLGRGPREHVYTTRTDNDDRTTVLFGDGHTGARTPTGVENLAAVYRNGIGRAGNVRAGQVSLLQSRPLGVKEVINPLRASGGADRESRDQARSNAPLAVASLDRLVSVADYADFARTFAGIGKAAAAELSDGRQTVVHLTVAGADDAPIDRESDLFANLRKALRDFGDPFLPIALDARELLLLVIEAKLKILPDHQWEVVSPAVRSALVQTFGFGRRGLGLDVARSEIIAAIQAVRGVDWVDLDIFGAFSTSVPDASSPDGLRPATPDEIGQAVRDVVEEQRDKAPRHRIAVELARPAGTGILPAQLAVLAPDLPATLVLNQIT